MIVNYDNKTFIVQAIYVISSMSMTPTIPAKITTVSVSSDSNNHKHSNSLIRNEINYDCKNTKKVALGPIF